jgi:SAM-dependent methyltransferase
MKSIDSNNPWDWLQPHDTVRFGEIIYDEAERSRWCTAILTGGLPMMWRKTAAPVRDLMYAKMELKLGANVLIVGESLDGCGFLDDIRERIGHAGTIHSFDIIEKARDSVKGGIRGRSGKLGTWAYDYTSGEPDDCYDCVGILQGVQHSDAWEEAAAEFVRVLKPGGMIMLAEIGFGPNLVNAMKLDIHLEYFIEKLFLGAGLSGMDLAYYSPTELRAAFGGLVTEATNFEWRGAELFWGRKP